MKTIAIRIAAALVLTVACVGLAQAQANRTYVRSNGVDAGNCGVTAPCLTFPYALSVTNSTGMITALDSSGYGMVVVDRHVTIRAEKGVVASIKVQPSTTGIAIAGAYNVDLENITVTGQGGASTIGLQVSHTGARVYVKDCEFVQLTTGINVTGGIVDLDGNNVSRNGTGIRADGPGPDLAPFIPGPGELSQPMTSLVRVIGGRIHRNAKAFEMSNPGGSVAGMDYKQGTQNACNIFLITTGSSQPFPFPFMVGNVRFLDLVGNGEFAGTYPDGFICQYAQQQTNKQSNNPAPSEP